MNLKSKNTLTLDELKDKNVWLSDLKFFDYEMIRFINIDSLITGRSMKRNFELVVQEIKLANTWQAKKLHFINVIRKTGVIGNKISSIYLMLKPCIIQII